MTRSLQSPCAKCHWKIPRPAYLDRVPLDDYDGQPFRYSRGNKLLYSVGENFQDNGGVERDVRGERLDDVYPIEF